MQANRLQERVEAMRRPVESGVVEDVLQQYSSGVAEELRQARDELRRRKRDTDPSIEEDHSVLCYSLALWELVHEVVVSPEPSPARILHWFNRHYLEDELAEWWEQAWKWSADPQEALKPDSPFWAPLCRLALSDCRAEVLRLLERSAEAADQHVASICHFLRKVPSLQQMDQAGASKAEYMQVMGEIHGMAGALLSGMPRDHPAVRLLRVYAGCPQRGFEDGEDVTAEMGRSWLEDLVFAHAWVFPELRKVELGDLLHAVVRRRASEEIGTVEHALFAVVGLDIAALLRMLPAMADRFPAMVVTHLVDVLYFAGQVPLGGETEEVPLRDWHLMRYAQELCRGPRLHKRIAADYLRAGGSEATVHFLELTAEEYCATATTEGEMDEAMTLLVDLGLAAKLGVKHCRRHAQALRNSGDLKGCLRWACQAEQYASVAAGHYVSELLDSMAESDEELEALLSILAPGNLEEPLERYPPESLLAVLAPSGAPLALAPSGRLYFFVQYARCRARRRAGRPASDYAPTLVWLLTAGVAAPAMVQTIIEELLPALREEAETPALSTEEALLLMQYVQGLARDPFGRVRLTVAAEELHRAMGACLSHAILCGSAQFGAASGAMVTPALVA